MLAIRSRAGGKTYPSSSERFSSAVPQPSGEPSGGMSRQTQQQQQQQQQRTSVKHTDNTVEVKSKFEAEYRRFGLKRNGFGNFLEFYHLLQNIHHIHGVDVLLEYADVHGDLLPIRNDENFYRAVSSAHPVLRILITKKEGDSYVYTTNSLQRRRKGLGLTALRPPGLSSVHSKNKSGLMIGPPQDFRQVSSIIDVDILPESYRRVRLHKSGSNKPLGFYIRDGVSMRVTPQGVEKVPGVFISRVVRGGLAESSGLLAVNDEILEVNGIDLTGKTLNQVTDMMVANSHNLVVTVKPANQINNIVQRGSKNSMGYSGSVGSGGSVASALSHGSPSPASQSNPVTASSSVAEGDSFEEDDDGDVILENDSAATYKSHPVTNSNSSTLSRDSSRRGRHSSIPQSVSMPASLAASLSHSSTVTTPHNGGSSHSVGSSQESMKEDGNVITL